MFRRVLVANRGEIALRVIRACRSLGIESVAVFSEADRGAPWLREADAAVCIGPGRADRSYLDAGAILQAAEQTGCQFFDIRRAWAEYVRASGKPVDTFKRDVVHANGPGEQILCRILVKYFALE